MMHCNLKRYAFTAKMDTSGGKALAFIKTPKILMVQSKMSSGFTSVQHFLLPCIACDTISVSIDKTTSVAKRRLTDLYHSGQTLWHFYILAVAYLPKLEYLNVLEMDHLPPDAVMI